ncbi:AAA family ATPase [Amycolatopsis lurida]
MSAELAQSKYGRAMTDPHAGEADELSAALDDVDLDSPSTTKFAEFEYVLAALIQLPRNQVYAVAVDRAAELAGLVQSVPANHAVLLAVVVKDAGQLAPAREAAERYLSSGGVPAALLLVRRPTGGWVPSWLAMQAELGRDELAGKVAELAGHLSLGVEHVKARTASERVRKWPGRSLRAADQPLVIDDRTRRMLRGAVASRSAVMLVGPPGTGKTQLVGEVIDDVAKDPERYGMTMAHDDLVVTPDESWSARELVGGETVDDTSKVRFSPGYVLEAIAQDRWLVLDEANRADLDRIFSGLFTWLTGNTVIVGRVSGDPKASPIFLGWADGPKSEVIGAELLRSDTPDNGQGAVHYLAGKEWRMFGTYNAVDAQRVFRFGLALGRRFAHVPIEMPSSEGFSQALGNRLSTLPVPLEAPVQAELVSVLQRIYRAHVGLSGVEMGPAALLSIPEYLDAKDLATSPSELRQRIAEAYLMGMGTWLATLDDTSLNRLQEELQQAEVLGDQWDWLVGKLGGLR